MFIREPYRHACAVINFSLPIIMKEMFWPHLSLSHNFVHVSNCLVTVLLLTTNAALCYYYLSSPFLLEFEVKIKEVAELSLPITLIAL